jgi:hypothetical protein
MEMSKRELLQRALEALEYGFEGELYRNLVRDILAELDKPEPVEYRTITLENGCLTKLTQAIDLHHGTYKLLAVRIDDDD